MSPGILRQGIVHRGMTDSQLNESFPPMARTSQRPALDPMCASVYGGLDHDQRGGPIEGPRGPPSSSPTTHTGVSDAAGMKRYTSDSVLSAK